MIMKLIRNFIYQHWHTTTIYGVKFNRLGKKEVKTSDGYKTVEAYRCLKCGEIKHKVPDAHAYNHARHII